MPRLRAFIRRLALLVARRLGPAHRAHRDRRAARQPGEAGPGFAAAPPWCEPPSGTAAALRSRAAEARARAAVCYERADAWSLANQRWKAETRCAAAQDALREAEFYDGQADALVRHQLEIVRGMHQRWPTMEVVHSPPPAPPRPAPRKRRRPPKRTRTRSPRP